MIGLHCRNVVFAAAAVVLVQGLSVPAQARGTASQAVSSVKETGNAEMATVSAPARNRSEASQQRRPCQKVAANAPMLFIGVGW